MRRMSQNFVLDWRTHLRLLLLFVGALALSSCAKFPANVTPDATRLTFRMTVRNEINQNYVYVIPIRVSTDPNPTDDGPIPVVSFPNANGFVAGNVDYFVLWTPDTQQYTLYRFNDTNLTQFTAIGVPINPVDVTAGSKTIGFDLTLDQIVGNAGTWDQIQSIQVNFLSMNFRLTAGTNPNDRVIDCLGDTRSTAQLNTPFKFSVATSAIYDNTFNPLEPDIQDCPDSDLDIVDWSVQVTRP